MKASVQVEPGICNFKTTVNAESEDSQDVTFAFETECETIKEFAAQVEGISPVDAIMTLTPDENPILLLSRKLLQTKGCCEACVVPAATVKVMQVVTQLALPKDVVLKITKV